MRIENLFVKDIFRPINGVVKVDQLDESSVWQELDEFVVTKELDLHLRKFFGRYRESITKSGDPELAGKIGVWVSGFFGSGKSHFIKVLSYLLDNEAHTHNGETKRAVDFFEAKIKDATLFGDIQKSVASDTDVILFNIDSKADSKAGRDAILAVFLKVLNELQGYSGDHPHLAHMERYLDGKGKYQQFKDTYRELTETEWVDERDAYEFNRDQVVEALSRTLEQSEESCTKWIDGAEGNFSLTVENFAKWVKEYLDSKGKNHRLIFLADEVGQFIGSDTHLMLNLQTITEELGTVCKGRAWVVVTSQEDIDAVLGPMQTSRANDFSKIQGRFLTRLSLSSANVDEVIQERLLLKRGEALPELHTLYGQKSDTLKNDLTFKNVGMTFKQIKDADDFAKNYPFVPYQFKLLQKIFESIRKVGATGLHLAQGERSLLDAFQSAGKAVANEEVGVLVPLYLFYPSIESFLDTSVKRTIDHARENQALEPFDAHVLEVLFLIRYVDEMKGTVDNLVTLCLDRIDTDKLALRRKIEASLLRLEKDSLVGRNGDVFFFLTNEERDINREIKNVEISSGDEAKLLGQLVFVDVFRDQKKHRYSANKKDISFNRVCDQHPVGNKVESGLVVSVLTPLGDDYETASDGRCTLDSSTEGGSILIRLGDDERLGRELRTYLKTEKYVLTRDDGTLSPQTRKIHSDLAADNRTRREMLSGIVKELLEGATYFVAGSKFEPKATAAPLMLEEALEYLVDNTFTKMSYLKVLCETPEKQLKEIQAVLRSNDIGQQTLNMTLPENNPQAIDDLRSYVELCTKSSKPIVLHDMITGRYANRPYGWPDLEVVLLLARLFVVGEIQFVMDGAPIPHDKVYEAITTQSKWRKITIVQKVTARPEDVRKARELGKQVFSEMGPEGEEPLFSFLQKKLDAWKTNLTQFKTQAETGHYPGTSEISEGLTLSKALLSHDQSNKFLVRFLERKDDLLGFTDLYHELCNFYEHQRPIWDKLRTASNRFALNRLELDRDEKAAAAIRRIGEILAAPAPYGLLHEAEGLIRTADEANAALVTARRATALQRIDAHAATLRAELDKASAAEALRSLCLKPFETLRKQVEGQESLAHIAQAEGEAERLLDAAMTRIEESLKPKEPKPGGGDPPVVKPRRVIKPSELVKSQYLETEAEVEGFLDRLRTEMAEALSRNERIQIK